MVWNLRRDVAARRGGQTGRGGLRGFGGGSRGGTRGRGARGGRGGAGGRGFRGRGGPRVAPGTYNVVLEVDGQTFTQPLVVSIDPDHPDGVWLRGNRRFEDEGDDGEEEDGS